MMSVSAPAGRSFECVGERPRTGGQGSDEGLAEVEEFLVPVFGACVVVGDVGGELPLLPVAELVELVTECAHAMRVRPITP